MRRQCGEFRVSELADALQVRRKLRFLKTFAFQAVFLVALILLASAEGWAKPTATSVRIAEHADKTRFVIDLSENVSYRMFTLQDPYRVVVDLPEIDWNISAKGLRTAKGVISNYRYGLFIPGTSRLVIDATGPVKIKKAFVLPPSGTKTHRFVVDLAKTSVAEFSKDMKSVGARLSPPAANQPVPTVPNMKIVPAERPKNTKKVIVIDPGHGGVDPGATSVSGRYEKHLTLKVARQMKKTLESTGRYKVVLTRNRDIFIRLRDRVNLARQANADLFISIHADTIKNRKIRGASVYTLSEKASDKEAADLAERENKSDVIAGIDLTHESEEVTNILIDLAQRETMNQSARFASTLVDELKQNLKVLRRSHRFAGFAVLKAPDIPSVLVELGFLSNRSDDKNLHNPEHHVRLATSLQSAIDAYFTRLAKLQIQ